MGNGHVSRYALDIINRGNSSYNDIALLKTVQLGNLSFINKDVLGVILKKYLNTVDRALLLWAAANIKPVYEVCIFNRVAELGHLNVLKWLKKQGYSWDDQTYESAALGGNMEVLRWLKDEECSWNCWSPARAAKGGHIEVLRWLRDNNCPFDGWACDSALKYGNFEVLKWLREHKYSWGYKASESVVSSLNFEMTKWAIENGCPVDDNTCSIAACYDNLVALRWLREQGYPFGKITNKDYYLPEIRQYLEENGISE